MTTYRHHTIYDPGLASPDRWSVGDAVDLLTIRFRLASGPEHVLTLTFDEADFHQVDGESFVTAPQRSADWLGAVEFVLRGAPEHVVARLRRP